MARLRGRVVLILAAVSLLQLLVSLPAGAASPSGASVLSGSHIRSVYVRPPQGATPTGKPLQVLLALHGMGNNGVDFSKRLIDQADRYGWLLVAPTIDYGDWTNPSQVASEDPALIRALIAYVDQLPQTTGFPIRHQMLLLGHSRGAQLAHRFAEFQPDRVLAVAALSAGTYTLPLAQSAQGKGLTFPFGINDLAHYTGHAFDLARFGGIRFWVGVGGQDTNPADLPRQWDPFEGTTRVQRAQAFEAAMQQLGARSVLRIFGGAQHDATGEMLTAACTFLRDAVLPRAPLGMPLAAEPQPI